jgi:hypothetical protein
MSKPDGPGEIRASIVVVLQFGHGGLGMVMVLALAGGSATGLSVAGNGQLRCGDANKGCMSGINILSNTDHRENLFTDI